MGVFRCTNPGGTWDNLETAHACLADLHAALVAGPVLGEVLRTRRGETPGERVVTGRHAVIVTAAHYSKIEDCTVRFTEVVP